jgi:hypothetical protein
MGFPWDHWGGTWTGIAFGTPISDGERVYTLTTHNHYTAWTHDGKLVWQKRFPRTTNDTVAPEHKDRIPAKGRWRPGWPGQGGFTTSPVMAEGVLLSCAGYMLRALDCKTGEVVWEKPYVVGLGQGMGVPALVELDGVTVMIAVGDGNNGDMPRDYQYPGDEIVRVADGQTVGYLPGPATKKGPSTGPVVVGDLVVSKVPAPGHKSKNLAVRLSWDDKKEQVVCTEVWRHDEKHRYPRGFNLFARSPWIDGKLYGGSAVMDLATGEILKDHDRQWDVSQGYCGEGAFIVGPAYVRWNLYGGKWVKRKGKEECGEYVAFDRGSGNLLGVGRIPRSPTDRKRMWVGAGTPYAAGGRLYVRSFDYLWCIGSR